MTPFRGGSRGAAASGVGPAARGFRLALRPGACRGAGGGAAGARRGRCCPAALGSERVAQRVKVGGVRNLLCSGGGGCRGGAHPRFRAAGARVAALRQLESRSLPRGCPGQWHSPSAAAAELSIASERAEESIEG